MSSYRSNKLKTAWDIRNRIENWPTAFGLRIRKHKPGMRLLSFRDGLNVVCRGGTRDWDVVHELLFAGGYQRALGFLRNRPGAPLVLDLGGNIGLFSLLAARAHSNAEIHAFEPGPPNSRLFEINRLANPSLSNRIHLHKEAVGGHTRSAQWSFDEANPGGSGFYGVGGKTFTVQIQAFSDVVASLPGQVALAKIDIEGAEYELLSRTEPAVWNRIDAIALELHGDPDGKITQTEFINRLKSFGYQVYEESVVSLFLHR